MEFTLRKPLPGDAESFALYANNPKVAQNLRDRFPYPYTLADAEGFLAMCAEEDETTHLTRVIDVDGKAVGCIGLSVLDDIYRKSAEIGYWLGEPFWNRGIMSEAIRRICAEGFERLDIVRIHAAAFAYNTGSCRALEKAGFAFEGVQKKSVYKNGQIYDARMYALIKMPYEK